ncbi:hypothetical protein AZI12_11260 [Levilactobacillus brevis]|nr:hypothetical protein AZI12_11260 [Levilactobacillus brevis]
MGDPLGGQGDCSANGNERSWKIMLNEIDVRKHVEKLQVQLEVKLRGRIPIGPNRFGTNRSHLPWY